ncbi:MAG: fumarylacetoacetate hydrolase family protein [Lachnospiraceae bacterium]|nr:fumarylacetoacetate hydrolase family protein [Lachnospiraceae bacterium]
MKLYTALLNKEEKLFVGFGEESAVYLLEDLGFVFEDMNDLICNITEEEKQSLYEMAESGINEKAYDVETLELLAPIVRPRQDVICLGINYDEHAKEAGQYSQEAFGGERPYTIYFSKRVSRATGPKEGIPSYEGLVDSLDYESELGVVLGKDIKGVSKEDALDAVFGYTVINDVSARNLQTRHKQWYVGKSMDGFTPIGPCIVTADEIEDVQNLDIKSFVNGELRQNSNTKYMIQTVAGAISELSQGMTLQAATVIATGTPAGVGMGMNPPCFLKKGDVVVCEIEKIGRIENPIV